MRWGDDDAIGEVRGAATVAHDHGAGHDRCRRESVLALDDRLDTVRCQHLERRVLRHRGQRMRVLAHVERTVDGVRAAVVADRLGDGEDVGRGEAAVERRAAMSARAELHTLARIRGIRPAAQEFALELGDVDQRLRRRRLASERVQRHQGSFRRSFRRGYARERGLRGWGFHGTPITRIRSTERRSSDGLTRRGSRGSSCGPDADHADLFAAQTRIARIFCGRTRDRALTLCRGRDADRADPLVVQTRITRSSVDPHSARA